MILKGNEVIIPLKYATHFTTYGFNWALRSIGMSNGQYVARKFPSKNGGFGGNCLASFNFSCFTDEANGTDSDLMPRSEAETNYGYYGAKDTVLPAGNKVIYSYMRTSTPSWNSWNAYTPLPQGMNVYTITDSFYNASEVTGFRSFLQKQKVYLCHKPANHSAISLDAAIGYFIILSSTYDANSYGIGWLCGGNNYVQNWTNTGTITTYIQPYPYIPNPTQDMINTYYPAASKIIGTATVGGISYYVIAVKSLLSNTLRNISTVWDGSGTQSIQAPLGWISQPYLCGSVDYFLHVGAEYYGEGYSP